MTSTEKKQTSIRHFKLSSGEEIVAIVGTRPVDEANNNMIIVEHPMLVRTAISETGFTFMFSVWQPLTDENICFINPLHIVSHVECADDIKERYIRICMQELEAQSSSTVRDGYLNESMDPSSDDDDDTYLDDILDGVQSPQSDTIH